MNVKRILSQYRNCHLEHIQFDGPPSTGKSICIQGPANAYTGYGLHASAIARGFSQWGYKVAFKALGPVESALPVEMVEACTFPTVAVQPLTSPLDARVDYWFTMHESTRMPPAMFSRLRMARQVIVPSNWNASCFNAQGLRQPMHVCPLGVDTFIFNPGEQPALCTFGAAGSPTMSSAKRKNMGMVVKAFALAFPDEKDVRLRIKILPGTELFADDARIEVQREQWSEFQMAAWARSLTAFVLPSRAEAWSLLSLQAMASGVPVIAAKFGGIMDYFSDSVGYGIDFKLEPADDGFYAGIGLWADPSMASLVERMRQVYEDQPEACSKGVAAREQAERFTWDVANERLEDILSSAEEVEEVEAAPVDITVSGEQISVSSIPVSILMVTKDTPPHLLRSCFVSILNQTHQAWELVILDSSENLETLAELKLVAAYPSVRLISIPGAVLGHSRRVCLSECRNELVAVMDSDDLMLPHRLEMQVREFVKHPEIDILGGQVEMFQDDNNELIATTEHPEQISLKELTKTAWSLNHSSVMYRKSSIQRVGSYASNVNACEDLDLWLRASAQGLKINNLPAVVARYRFHPKQTWCATGSAGLSRSRDRVLNKNKRTSYRPRVSFYTDSLYCGGAERWLCDLVRSTSADIEWVAVGVESCCSDAMRHELSNWVKVVSGMPTDSADVGIIWLPGREDISYPAKKLVVVSHMVTTAFMQERHKLFLRSLMQSVDVAVGCTERSLNYFDELGLDSTVKRQVILNGFTETIGHPIAPKHSLRMKFGFKENDYVVGYLGRICSLKGFAQMLEASSMFDSGIHLVVTGNVETDTIAQEIAARPNVTSIGWIEDSGSFLNAIDCLLHPSLQEAFANVVCEAWMAGTPVIATPCGIQAQHPGYLTLPLSAEPSSHEIAHAVNKAARLKPKPNPVIQAYALEHYSLTAFSKRWVDAIKNLL